VDSGRIWSQSAARRSLVGTERTHNPSPAAASLLRKGLGRRLFRKAKSVHGKRRRRFHRGNPAPAAVASIASSLAGSLGLGGIFKKPSEKRAAAVAGAVVASAIGGNLTAARAIFERSRPTFGIAKERAVWAAAWAQIPKHVKDALTKYAEAVPGVDHTNPETAAASALSSPVELGAIEAAAAEASRMSKAERAAAAREERASRERTLGTLADVGVAGLQAFAGRGRRPRSRRRRRRSTGRRISL